MFTYEIEPGSGMGSVTTFTCTKQCKYRLECSQFTIDENVVQPGTYPLIRAFPDCKLITDVEVTVNRTQFNVLDNGIIEETGPRPFLQEESSKAYGPRVEKRFRSKFLMAIKIAGDGLEHVKILSDKGTLLAEQSGKDTVIINCEGLARMKEYTVDVGDYIGELNITTYGLNYIIDNMVKYSS